MEAVVTEDRQSCRSCVVVFSIGPPLPLLRVADYRSMLSPALLTIFRDYGGVVIPLWWWWWVAHGG